MFKRNAWLQKTSKLTSMLSSASQCLALFFLAGAVGMAGATRLAGTRYAFMRRNENDTSSLTYASSAFHGSSWNRALLEVLCGPALLLARRLGTARVTVAFASSC